MVGLLARETLTLTPFQAGAMVLNALTWLTVSDKRKAAIASLALAVIAFWGVMLCFDTRLTWNHLANLNGRILHLSEMVNHSHLNTNTPIWSWLASAFPSYQCQQGVALALSAVTMGCLFDLYADRARYVLACPLWFLCCSQPLPGVYALGFLAMGRVLYHRGQKLRASLSLLAAMLVKYTAYSVLPFVVWEFRLWSIPVCVGLVGFWGWFAQTDSLLYAFQRRFLLSHFLMGLQTGSVQRAISRNVRRVQRQPYLHTLPGALFYGWSLEPMMRPYWLVMAGMLLFGGKNLKYLLPLLACLPRKEGGAYAD